MESSKYGEDEKSRNMINVQVAREKSTLEHRSNNVQHTVENVACAQPNVSHEEDEIMLEHRSNNVLHTVENVVHAQPSVSHEEDEIRNSNFEHVPRNYS